MNHSNPLRNDRALAMVNGLVNYRFGSLWWGRDDLIHSKQPVFYERADRTGHPLVSVMRKRLEARTACVPMLVGTSGASLPESVRARCVVVKGLTKEDPDHRTLFGSIVAPGLYGFDDVLDAFLAKKGNFLSWWVKGDGRPPHEHVEKAPWHANHRLSPNRVKPEVDAPERRRLEEFCERHHL